MTTSDPDGAAYTVADHLLDRLAELGVDRLFGVPGDFTLALLDHVVRHPGVSWTGCTNELNAGYAADGYGRVKGIAAVCTTFGVGELSALNALAGSFAEHVPVVEVVGAPPTGSQAAGRVLHHSLGDGTFTHFLAQHREVTCAAATLTAATAVAEIDRVLTAVRDQRLPGYLLLPTDVAATPVAPATAALPAASDPTDPEVLAAFTAAARAVLAGLPSVRATTVLAGLLVHRFGAVGPLQALLAAAGDPGLPHATTLWSKSLVDESAASFLGSYVGGVSQDAVRAAVEDAPALVVAGVQFTDLTSGLFTQQLTRLRTIEVAASTSSVGAASFSPLSLPAALSALAGVVAELAAAGQPAIAGGTGPDLSVDHPADPPADPPADEPAGDGDEPLRQTSLWSTVAASLRSGDVVLADQGTSFYGMGTRRLPPGVLFLGQPLWASIGWTLPATLGACLAAPGRRGVLLIGDGAAQMTMSELATVLRHDLDPLLVVVDNDGYTVERAIHGPDAPYNDIARVDWTALLAALGPGRPSRSVRVSTVGELRAALEQAASDRAAGVPGPTLVQAVVPALDVPPLLAALTRALAATNARHP